MLLDEMMLKDNCLNLDIKKTCYPDPVKINTICISKKQVLRACSRQRLRVFNGTNY